VGTLAAVAPRVATRGSRVVGQRGDTRLACRGATWRHAARVSSGDVATRGSRVVRRRGDTRLACREATWRHAARVSWGDVATRGSRVAGQRGDTRLACRGAANVAQSPLGYESFAWFSAREPRAATSPACSYVGRVQLRRPRAATSAACSYASVLTRGPRKTDAARRETAAGSRLVPARR
jgi:hypothetical protein